MISRTSEYAIRAMAALAWVDTSRSVLARDVAQASGVPRNYLAKILGELRRRGLVDSLKGPGGGFRLSRPPEQVSLFEIVEVFEDLENQRRCFLGDEFCATSRQCSVACRWHGVWSHYETFLQESSLAELAFHNQKHPRLAERVR